MTTEQWTRLRTLLDKVMDEPAIRPSLLDELRGHDPEVCAELERLLSDLDAGDGCQDDSSPAETAGLQIGPYRIVREIGRGGAGTVFLARRDDAGVQVPFALKVLRRDFLRGTSNRSFHRELRVLARLDHPHIARLLDWGTIPGGLFYLALEYVDGLPITHYCGAMRIHIKGRIGLLLQVCAAVEHAHRHLIVHRDLKPSNILVTAAADDSPAKVKLLDFGIASELDSTQATTMLGSALTPAYASPEQIAGRSVTVASDVYSLGLLLYELLAGQLPGSGEPDPVHARLEGSLQPPSRRAGLSEAPAHEIAGDLDSIVLKTLQAEPERRYPSVEQLAADLRRYLEGRPVEARRTSRFYVAGRFLLRNRWNVAAAALAAAALSTTSAIAIWNWRTAVRNLAEAQRDYQTLRNFAQAVISNADARTAASPVEAQRKLSDTIARYLDQLSQGRKDDEQLQLQIAMAYNYLGNAQGAVNNPNQGDPGAALANYEKAYRIELEQWRARASRASGLLLIASSGNIAQVQPDPASAADFLSRGVETTQPLLSRYPNDGVVLAAFASAFGGRGQRRRSAGDFEGAIADFEKAVDLAVRAQQWSPVPPEALTVQETFQSERGSTLRMEGRLVEALDLQNEARQIALRALQVHPANHTRRQAAFKLLSRAETLRRLKRYADAQQAAAEAEAELQPIAAADPADVQAKIDLSLAEIRLGDIALSEGRVRDALGKLGNALRLRREQYARHGSNPQATRSYQAILGRYGEAELEAGDRRDAAAHFQEAIVLGVRLRQLTPSDAYAAADLAGAHRGAAECALANGRHEALDLMQQSVNLWREVRKRCPLDVELASAAQHAEQILASWPTRFSARSKDPARRHETPAPMTQAPRPPKTPMPSR